MTQTADLERDSFGIPTVRAVQELILASQREEFHDLEELIGRQPTAVEKSITESMWSEHAGYGSSRPFLQQLPTKVLWKE